MSQEFKELQVKLENLYKYFNVFKGTTTFNLPIEGATRERGDFDAQTNDAMTYGWLHCNAVFTVREYGSGGVPGVVTIRISNSPFKAKDDRDIIFRDVGMAYGLGLNGEIHSVPFKMVNTRDNKLEFRGEGMIVGVTYHLVIPHSYYTIESPKF